MGFPPFSELAPRRFVRLALCALLVGLAAFATSVLAAEEAGTESADASHLCVDRPFEPNLGAGADVIRGPEDFLPCRGFPYALCYYSGPDPMPCVLEPGEKTARCDCYYVDKRDRPAKGTSAHAKTEIFFVDKAAILNRCIAEETIAYCEKNPDACREVNGAPVCWYVENHPELFAPAEFAGEVQVVSTFSFAQVEGATIGCTNCKPGGLYAGCMTAPCQKTTNADGDTVAQCRCPVAEGVYQVGQNDVSCDLGTNADGQELVWSAAASTSEECATPSPSSAP